MFIFQSSFHLLYKIHEVLKLQLPIVDVDRSYLYRKEQKLILEGIKTVPLPSPDIPPSGWEVLSRANFKEKGLPKVTSGEYSRVLAKMLE